MLFADIEFRLHDKHFIGSAVKLSSRCFYAGRLFSCEPLFMRYAVDSYGGKPRRVPAAGAFVCGQVMAIFYTAVAPNVILLTSLNYH